MKFGLILQIQSKDASLDQLWEENRELTQVAEEAGFDAVFLPEFHQAIGGAFVSPLLLGAGLLQGTTRIRFGPAVLAMFAVNYVVFAVWLPIPIFSAVAERVVCVLLGVFLYKLLTRELARYRDVLDYMARYLR